MTPRSATDLKVEVAWEEADGLPGPTLHTYTLAPDPNQVLLIGRDGRSPDDDNALSKRLGVDRAALGAISGRHFTLSFASGHFWLSEHSRHGTHLRPTPPPAQAGQPAPGGVFRKYTTGQSVALEGDTDVKLVNAPGAQYRNVILRLLVPPQYASSPRLTTADPEGAVPTAGDPLWDRHLLPLLARNGAVHLCGLPGSGKQRLLGHLDEGYDTARGQERDRILSQPILPVSLDGWRIAPDDSGLFRPLAQAILRRVNRCAREAGYPSAGNTAGQAADDLDKLSVSQASVDRVAGLLDVGLKPFAAPWTRLLLIINHFDGLFVGLEPSELYYLSTPARLPYLVVSTARPFALLRDDLNDPKVYELCARFAHGTVTADHDRYFDALLAAMTGVPHDRLVSVKDQLHRLSGGNPGLLTDLVHWIAAQRWDDDAHLADGLEAHSWANEELPTAKRIWDVLRGGERRAALAVANGLAPDPAARRALEDLGILCGDRIFSDAFRDRLSVFNRQTQTGQIGLRIDQATRQVFRDGQLLDFNDGAKPLEILLAIHKLRNNSGLASYNDLCQEVYGRRNDRNDREALQKSAGRMMVILRDSNGTYVRRVRGEGYWLSPDVV